MSGNDRLTIAVVGAGAIGGWVAVRLASAGHRVMALTARGPIDALHLTDGDRSETASFEKFEGPADLLIVAVKATALASAVPSAARLLGSGTVVLPMLNGVPWWFTDQPLKSVDPDGAVGRAIPKSRIVGAVVHASCSRPAQGQIVVKHADRLIVGEPEGGDSDRVERLASLFEQAGVRCEQSGNVRRAIWYKLWGNATINPLSALTRASCDLILVDPECRAWMLAGMSELSAIGAAIGCAIEESGEDRMAVTARLGAFKTSMLQDVEAGRRIELEALLGAPREIALRHGIATPALDRLYHVTKLLADSLAG
ncbi:MAG TPA: 2-dehydropantoate 2-reductase [Sphingomicrobium sp.]|nr:2-dehydropantoate 2-reductase [Sphingomicrobium sp.]